MINENAALWTAALRTYPQNAQDSLGGPTNGYCPLGVACVLYEGATGERLPRGADGEYASWSGTQVLMDEFAVVREWMGMRSAYGLMEGILPSGPGMAGVPRPLSIAAMHRDGFPFRKIADEIEAQASYLFHG